MLSPTGITFEQYMSALNSDAPTHLRATFLGKNITLTDQDIESSGLTLQQVFNGDTDVTMGRSLMSSITLPILKTDRLNNIRWDDEVKLEIGVEYGGETYWTTIGYFTGTNRFKAVSISVVNYSASDRMQKFDAYLASEWLNTIEFPMTFGDMYHSLCDFVGVPYEDGDELPNIMNREFASNPLTGSSELTCREILSLLAEACCCNAKITADGNCRMCWFQEHLDYVVPANDQFNLEHFDIMAGKTWAELEEYTWEELEDLIWAELGGYESLFVIDALIAKQQELGQFVGYPEIAQNGNIYMLVDNPFLISETPQDNTDYIEPIYNRLRQFKGYLPSTLDCVGNPLLEAGDIIMVEVDGRKVIVPIFVKTVRWNGSVIDTYEATGNVQREIITSSIKSKLSQGNKYTVQNLISIANETITIKAGGKLVLEEGSTVEGLNLRKCYRYTKTYSSKTIPSTGYVLLDSTGSFPTSSSGYVISMNIRGWSGITGCFNVVKGSNGTDIYLIGSAQTITSITVEYVIIDSIDGDYT